jgi:hypothetical protein
MSQTKNFLAFTAGAAASLFLALLASSPIAAADSTAPPGPGAPQTERPAAQQKPPSLPETLKTTAMYMKAVPATPALVLQSSSSFVTSAAATPAEILTASAAALGAFGVK